MDMPGAGDEGLLTAVNSSLPSYRLPLPPTTFVETKALGDRVYSRSKKKTETSLFISKKLSYGNETGTNHLGLLSTSG